MRWIGAVAAVVVLTIAGTAAAQEDGESFAALAYLRVPFTANPYLGVAVERDRVEASRAEARNFEPLWLRPRVLDVHLNSRTLEPLRINGLEVQGESVDYDQQPSAWAARIE